MACVLDDESLRISATRIGDCHQSLIAELTKVRFGEPPP
jgi:hypothetical protein